MYADGNGCSHGNGCPYLVAFGWGVGFSTLSTLLNETLKYNRIKKCKQLLRYNLLGVVQSMWKTPTHEVGLSSNAIDVKKTCELQHIFNSKPVGTRLFTPNCRGCG